VVYISKKIDGAQIANYTPHLALVMAVSDPSGDHKLSTGYQGSCLFSS